MDRSTLLPEMVDDALDAEDAPHQVILLYRRRLARLLAPDGASVANLTTDEQRHLRRRAVLITVRALTGLGDGEAASRLLREAGR